MPFTRQLAIILTLIISFCHFRSPGSDEVTQSLPWSILFMKILHQENTIPHWLLFCFYNHVTVTCAFWSFTPSTYRRPYHVTCPSSLIDWSIIWTITSERQRGFHFSAVVAHASNEHTCLCWCPVSCFCFCPSRCGVSTTYLVYKALLKRANFLMCT